MNMFLGLLNLISILNSGIVTQVGAGLYLINTIIEVRKSRGAL